MDGRVVFILILLQAFTLINGSQSNYCQTGQIQITRSQDTTKTVSVTFSTPFTTIPVVALAIKSGLFSAGSNSYYQFYHDVSNISVNGFDVIARSQKTNTNTGDYYLSYIAIVDSQVLIEQKLIQDPVNVYIRDTYPSDGTDTHVFNYPTSQFATIPNSLVFISGFDVQKSIENTDADYQALEFSVSVTATPTTFELTVNSYGATLIWKLQLYFISWEPSASIPFFKKSILGQSPRTTQLKLLDPLFIDSFTQQYLLPFSGFIQIRILLDSNSKLSIQNNIAYEMADSSLSLQVGTDPTLTTNSVIALQSIYLNLYDKDSYKTI